MARAGPAGLRLFTAPDGATRVEPLVLPWAAERGPNGELVAELAHLGGGVVLRRVYVEDPAFHPSPARHLVIHLDGQATLELSDSTAVPLTVGTVAVSEDVSGIGHRIRRSSDSGPRLILLFPLGDD